MEFVRSSPAPRRDCTLGPRDQINQITSFIDASNIYGSTAEEQGELRLMKSGEEGFDDDDDDDNDDDDGDDDVGEDDCDDAQCLLQHKHHKKGEKPSGLAIEGGNNLTKY